MKKFYSIEILRFLTSLTILFYHYRHFFSPYNKNNENIYYQSVDNLPFYEYLKVFYEKGYYGVSVFWCVSGFVFALMYLNKNHISITGKEFFIKRFARLYPLHFLTLFFVAFLQYLNLVYFGTLQFNYLNDIYHFFLNLFFISSWGFEHGFSFNGPIWSVSVEIVIYFFFFFFLKYINSFKKTFTFLIIIALTFLDKLNLFSNFLSFLDCGRLFFSGVLIFLFYKSRNNSTINMLFFISVFLLIISFIGNFKIFIFCPALVLFFISIEDNLKNKKLNFLFEKIGNMTYSMYLIHVPAQMIICLIFGFLGYYNIYLSKLFLIMYLSIIFLFSFLIYRFFENPLNLFIRKKFNY